MRLECGMRGCLHGVCGSWCRMGDCADGSMIGGLSAFVCLQGLELQPADDAAFRRLQKCKRPSIFVSNATLDTCVRGFCIAYCVCMLTSVRPARDVPLTLSRARLTAHAALPQREAWGAKRGLWSLECVSRVC